MKQVFKIMLVTVILIGCKKSNTCENAEITKMFKGTACEKWGISIGSNVYAAPNLATEFEKDSLKVCVTFKLYDDLKMCPCCGGTTADIISIERR